MTTETADLLRELFPRPRPGPARAEAPNIRLPSTDTPKQNQYVTNPNADALEYMNQFNANLERFKRQQRDYYLANPNLYQADRLFKRTGEENLNDLSQRSTMRLSRLADAINNKPFVRGGNISTRGAVTGGQVTGQSLDVGNRYRHNIETEEMRQAQHLRGLQAQIHGAEATRQQRTKDRGLEESIQEYAQQLTRSGMSWEEALSRSRAVFDLSIQYDDMAQRLGFTYAERSFMEQLAKLQIPPAQAAFITNNYSRYPAFSMMLANLSQTATPSPSSYLFLRQLSDLLDEAQRTGMTDEEAARRLSEITVQQAGAEVEGAVTGAGTAARGVGEAARNAVTPRRSRR